MAAAQVPDPRQPSPQAPGGARQGGWTAGRIIAVVVGSILVLCSVGLLGGSGVALWAQTNRHGGYADLATATYSVPGYAIASDTVSLHLGNGAASGLIGTVRIRVTQVSGTTPAFIGIAPASAAARNLAGVDYATVSGATDHHGTYSGPPARAVPKSAGDTGIEPAIFSV